MSLSVLTYNLHGFNNGGSFLSSCIYDYNIACVQEHWLHEEELTKLRDYFPGYGCISISNMSPEDISWHRGPYGGLAIYYFNGFQVQMLGSSSDKCVLATKLNYNSHNFIIFNVYFPCLSVSIKYFDQIALISGFIDNIVQDHYDSDSDIIISGDFNCSAKSFINNDALLMLLDLFNSYDLKLCYDYYNGRIDYTFKCASHNSFTWIDHIFVSKPLLDNLVKVSVIDCGSNMSDHCILGFKAS